jgi:hypothetical protein
VKKEVFQDCLGKPSMMRYLSFYAFVFGGVIGGLSFTMLCIAFFLNSLQWASYFMTLCLSGLASTGAGIAGKAVQKKHEAGL